MKLIHDWIHLESLSLTLFYISLIYLFFFILKIINRKLLQRFVIHYHDYKVLRFEDEEGKKDKLKNPNK